MPYLCVYHTIHWVLWPGRGYQVGARPGIYSTLHTQNVSYIHTVYTRVPPSYICGNFLYAGFLRQQRPILIYNKMHHRRQTGHVLYCTFM